MMKYKSVFVLILLIVFNMVFVRFCAKKIIGESYKKGASSTKEKEIIEEETNPSKKVKELISNYLQEDESADLPLNSTIDFIQNGNLFLPERYPLKANFHVSQHSSEEHRALDFATKRGENVIPSAFGVVTDVSYDNYFGNYIRINHLNGYQTFYAHLGKVFVQKDDFVRIDQVIGEAGNTGFSEFPHLHFEIIFAGEKINPATILKD